MACALKIELINTYKIKISCIIKNFCWKKNKANKAYKKLMEHHHTN